MAKAMQTYKEVVMGHSVLTADQKQKLLTAERLFRQAKRSQENGHNGGSSALLVEYMKVTDAKHAKAEAILHEIYGPELKIDYPGLMPTFQIKGHDYIDLHSLVKWAAV